MLEIIWFSVNKINCEQIYKVDVDCLSKMNVIYQTTGRTKYCKETKYDILVFDVHTSAVLRNYNNLDL